MKFNILFLLLMYLPTHKVSAQTIFDLARSGSVKQMQKYLKKHPEHINLISDHGASPFLLAAYRGNNEVAQLLLDKGADFNYCYAEGSVIYALIYKNNLVLLEEILKRGANPDIPCQFEQMGYPLHFALSLQRIDALLLLKKYNTNLNVVDQQGRTLLQLMQLYNNPKLNEILQNEK
ncbi:MAG: ankyrin repeat domain-containing protein [Sphingomonadales bacterium]|nr:ankyrin repeat domain-containing protein [Sphingomonadales bacterium]